MPPSHFRLRTLLAIGLISGLLCPGIFCENSYGASKRDYKGLFGSYRREKFTENEARSGEFGVDLSISTLLPLTNVVGSYEGSRPLPSDPSGYAGLQYSSFFNGEVHFTYSVSYSLVAFGMVGYYSYDTRKQNQSSLNNPTQPFFHEASFSSIPVLGGIRYRFSTSDIVPYLTGAAGVSLITRRGYYDYSNFYQQQSDTALTLYAGGGFEFFISPRTGIRLELTAMYIAAPSFAVDSGQPPNQFPVMLFQQNLMTVRYSSGIFFLF